MHISIDWIYMIIYSLNNKKVHFQKKKKSGGEVDCPSYTTLRQTCPKDACGSKLRCNALILIKDTTQPKRGWL